MDDFISLTTTKLNKDTEECDVLNLVPEDDVTNLAHEKKPTNSTDTLTKSNAISNIKPFYPSCKRVLTRPPFFKRTNLTSSSEKTKEINPSATQLPIKSSTETSVTKSSNENANRIGATDSLTKVKNISLEQLMSIEDVKSPEKRRRPTAMNTDERVLRLQNQLKQSEVEKATLQGYVADLQAKLVVLSKPVTKSSETQTNINGVKCPTCSSRTDPSVLLQSFGKEFLYDDEKQKFIHISSGFIYDPYTQLYTCTDTGVVYYWDTTHNIYHYHSNINTPLSTDIFPLGINGIGSAVTESVAAESAAAESAAAENVSDEEEEGELRDNNLSEELSEVAQKAMKKNGIEFIPSVNMYFNKNTGLYYCQSSGLYYDTRMSVFYTLTDGQYKYHSTAKPDEISSAYAKTSIRAIVKETNCHKVKAGMLFMFTCMGGSIGREGNHVALFPEIRVSKRHATISYCAGRYYITDEGTMNGTYLNETRLSVQKEVSDRFELSHLDELKIGSTLLQLHIHNNNDTCKWCEPGLQTQPVTATTISEPPTLYKLRNKETNRLKRKYKLMGNN